MPRETFQVPAPPRPSPGYGRDDRVIELSSSPGYHPLTVGSSPRRRCPAREA